MCVRAANKASAHTHTTMASGTRAKSTVEFEAGGRSYASFASRRASQALPDAFRPRWHRFAIVSPALASIGCRASVAPIKECSRSARSPIEAAARPHWSKAQKPGKHSPWGRRAGREGPRGVGARRGGSCGGLGSPWRPPWAWMSEESLFASYSSAGNLERRYQGEKKIIQ